MKQKRTIQSAAIFGTLAVLLGAFGAHAFKPALIATGKLDTYELAVRYQFYHVFALLSVGILMHHFLSKKLHLASLCFSVGILFFSGSLYILSFTGIGVWGAVTPVGGVLFILGWVFLFLGISENNPNNKGPE